MNKTKLYKISIRLAQPLLFVIICGLLINEGNKDWTGFTAIEYDFTGANVLLLILAILFVFLNWLIETLKWKRLMSDVHPISLKQAHRSVLQGVTFGIVTPARIGEYGGRLMSLPSSVRMKALTLSMFSSFFQLLATLIFAAVGFIVMGEVIWNEVQLNIEFQASYLIALLLLIAVVLLVSRKRSLKTRLLKSYQSTKETINTARHHWRYTMMLSIGRYLVFASQYCMILEFFGAGVNPFQSFALVTLVYFINTLLPMGMIVGLGVRTASALLLFEMIGANGSAVIVSTIFTWAINLFIPALIGLASMLENSTLSLQWK